MAMHCLEYDIGIVAEVSSTSVVNVKANYVAYVEKWSPLWCSGQTS
jgi:hypothetical protein